MRVENVICNPPTMEKQLSFVANGIRNYVNSYLLLVKTGLSNGVLEPLCNQGKVV